MRTSRFRAQPIPKRKKIDLARNRRKGGLVGNLCLTRRPNRFSNPVINIHTASRRKIHRTGTSRRFGRSVVLLATGSFLMRPRVWGREMHGTVKRHAPWRVTLFGGIATSDWRGIIAVVSGRGGVGRISWGREGLSSIFGQVALLVVSPKKNL